jgi:hypothetical protein
MDITEIKITSTVTIFGVNKERTDPRGATIPTPWKKSLQVGTKINIEKDLVNGVGLGSLLQLTGFAIEEQLAKVTELKPFLPEKDEDARGTGEKIADAVDGV